MNWKSPSASQLIKQPVHLLAFGFGSGLAPRAPGTFGTLAAIPLWCVFQGLPLWIYGALLVMTFGVGVYICGRSAELLGVHDHPGIVWDEFVGLWVTLIGAPLHWAWILLGFLWFRLFDIAKPWPIRWCDRRIGGGFGIMVDDLLAGLMALVALHLSMRIWPW